MEEQKIKMKYFLKPIKEAWPGSSCSQPRHTPSFSPGFDMYVPLGFLKGGRELVDHGLIGENALRERDQETGISRDRLQFAPDQFFDDTTVGARMFLALCSECNGMPDPLHSKK